MKGNILNKRERERKKERKKKELNEHLPQKLSQIVFDRSNNWRALEGKTGV